MDTFCSGFHDKYHLSDKDADSKSKMKRIEADLKLLKLQVKIFQLG